MKECQLSAEVELLSTKGETKKWTRPPISMSFEVRAASATTITVLYWWRFYWCCFIDIKSLILFVTRVGARYHVLDGDPIPQGEAAILGWNVVAHCKVMGHSAVSCADTTEPIEMLFGWRLGWAHGTTCQMGVQIPQEEAAILSVFTSTLETYFSALAHSIRQTYSAAACQDRSAYIFTDPPTHSVGGPD